MQVPKEGDSSPVGVVVVAVVPKEGVSSPVGADARAQLGLESVVASSVTAVWAYAAPFKELPVFKAIIV